MSTTQSPNGTQGPFPVVSQLVSTTTADNSPGEYGCAHSRMRRALRVATRDRRRRRGRTDRGDPRLGDPRRPAAAWRLSQRELGRKVGLIAESRQCDRAWPWRRSPARCLGRARAGDRPAARRIAEPTDPAGGSLADAGHLEIQEYLLEIGRRNGRRGAFELPTRPNDPSQSIDVYHVDSRHDCLIIQEAWNRIGDLGASARSSSARSQTWSGRGQANRVALCWVVRDSHANHAIVRRFPEMIAARFTGSSIAWVERPRERSLSAARTRHRLVRPVASSAPTHAVARSVSDAATDRVTAAVRD